MARITQGAQRADRLPVGATLAQMAVLAVGCRRLIDSYICLSNAEAEKDGALTLGAALEIAEQLEECARGLGEWSHAIDYKQPLAGATV